MLLICHFTIAYDDRTGKIAYGQPVPYQDSISNNARPAGKWHRDRARTLESLSWNTRLCQLSGGRFSGVCWQMICWWLRFVL